MTLYNDKFVTVGKLGVSIKWYYFPIATEKRIPIESIRSVEYVKQSGTNLFWAKNWGMSLSPVWWACDMNRFFLNRNYNVVVDLIPATGPNLGLA